MHEPHVAPLNRWVERVRAETGEDVPYFDPASGGIHAWVLLLKDPSGAASEGSGFISRHNNDGTASNLLLACEEAGLGYERALHWNVIPWWGNARPDRSMKAQLARARPYLTEMLELLDAAPAAVVLLGAQAQRAWEALTADGTPAAVAGARVLRCPHPSPRSCHHVVDPVSGRRARDVIVAALSEAARLAL